MVAAAVAAVACVRQAARPDPERTRRALNRSVGPLAVAALAAAFGAIWEGCPAVTLAGCVLVGAILSAGMLALAVLASRRAPVAA